MIPFFHALSGMFTPPGYRWELEVYGIGPALCNAKGNRVTPVFDPGFLAGKYKLYGKGKDRKTLWSAADNLARELRVVVNREDWRD